MVETMVTPTWFGAPMLSRRKTRFELETGEVWLHGTTIMPPRAAPESLALRDTKEPATPLADRASTPLTPATLPLQSRPDCRNTPPSTFCSIGLTSSAMTRPGVTSAGSPTCRVSPGSHPAIALALSICRVLVDGLASTRAGCAGLFETFQTRR